MAASKVVVCDSLEDLLSQVFGVHLRDGNDTAGEPQVEPQKENCCSAPSSCGCTEGPSEVCHEEAEDRSPEEPDDDGKAKMQDLMFERDYSIDLSFAEIILIRQALHELPHKYVEGVMKTLETAKSPNDVMNAITFTDYALNALKELDQRLAEESEDASEEARELQRTHPNIGVVAKNFI